VVWREGFLNEPDRGSEIWGARVSADGKALDPAGIPVAKGKGLKDRPVAASDGKDFLVLWQEMPGGKSWDVWGARVGGDGKASDPVMVAGGEDNQCWPAVGFAKGNYVAAWQGWVNGGYGIYCARLSSECRVLDAKPAEVVGGCAVRGKQQGIMPAICTRGDELLVSGICQCFGQGQTYLFGRFVDPATGQPQGAAPPFPGYDKKKCTGPLLGSETTQNLAVAMGKKGRRFFATCWGTWGVSSFNIHVTDDEGKAVHLPDWGVSPLKEQYFIWVASQGFIPRQEVAFDGDKLLVVADWSEGNDRPRKADDLYNQKTSIYGWRVGDDGRITKERRFLVAEGGPNGRNQVCPSVAAGPAGSCLVAWSDIRGADDVKVLARVVK
jgi:hypothetical protein